MSNTGRKWTEPYFYKNAHGICCGVDDPCAKHFREPSEAVRAGVGEYIPKPFVPNEWGLRQWLGAYAFMLVVCTVMLAAGSDYSTWKFGAKTIAAGIVIATIWLLVALFSNENVLTRERLRGVLGIAESVTN